MKLGGIEAGGTKMVCAIGDEQGNIFDRVVFPTESPQTTVPKMIEYFRDKGIEALGIGCFGPVDLNKNRLLTAILPVRRSWHGDFMILWELSGRHYRFLLALIRM